jgi:hypothetical protein
MTAAGEGAKLSFEHDIKPLFQLLANPQTRAPHLLHPQPVKEFMS